MRQVIAVPPSVTVRSAHQFAQEILAGFDTERDLDLDLSALGEVDLAFVQIVIAARDQWTRAGRDLRLVQPAGGTLVALLDRAGFLTDPTPQDTEFWFHGELPQ